MSDLSPLSCLVTNKNIFEDSISLKLTNAVEFVDTKINSIKPMLGAGKMFIKSPTLLNCMELIENYPMYRAQYLPIIIEQLNVCVDKAFEDPNTPITEGKKIFNDEFTRLIDNTFSPLLEQLIVKHGIEKEYLDLGIPILEKAIERLKQ